MTGAAGRGRGVVLAVGRGDILRQPTPVGADHGDRLGRQLDQHAPQGVPRALHVGGEDGAADQLLEVGRRDHMVGGRAEVGHLREEARILHRQGELRMQAPDHQPIVLGFDRQLHVAAGPQDRTDLGRRQDHRAGPLDLHAEHPVANPDFQVRPHENRAGVGVGDQLDVLEDRLGAPRRNHAADQPERREQALTVAQGPHSICSPGFHAPHW